MTKKFLSMFLALAMCLSLTAPVVAVEEREFGNTAKTYIAQVHHAEGVNEYGSNIWEVMDSCPNVPITINQSQGGSLRLELQFEGMSIVLDASVRGKNLKGNVVYYDILSINESSLEVLTLAYIEEFSQGTVIAQKYCKENPNAKNVLEIYFKVTNSETREYYFFEIFDFALTNFSALSDEQCKADYWTVKEFLPVSNETSEGTNANARYLNPSVITHTFTSTHKWGVIYDLVSSVTVTATFDRFDTIVKGQNITGIYRLEITDQSTICEEGPEFNDDQAIIKIAGISFKISAPQNCAIRSTEFEGKAHKLGITSNPLSATVGLVLGPISLSVNLGELFKNDGSVLINDTFKTYNNSDPNNRTRAVNLDFKNSCYLLDTENYLAVEVEIGDYGNVVTTANPMYSRWEMSAVNSYTGETISSGYVLGSSNQVKVN